MPAPGVPTPELRVAQFRGHARRLFWSALVLIAVAGACGWFYDNLPAPFENWMMFAAAGAVVFLLVVLPFLAWWSHVYTITTRRVIERRGILAPHRRELAHVRGYTIVERRGHPPADVGSGHAHALERRRRAAPPRGHPERRARARGARRPGRGEPDPRAPRRAAASARAAAALSPSLSALRAPARPSRCGMMEATKGAAWRCESEWSAEDSWRA